MKRVEPASSTTTAAARRLGITPEAVYCLVFEGALAGRPDADGVVHITEQAIIQYERSHPASAS